MSIEIIRTATHTFDGHDDEAVLFVNILTPDQGEKFMTINRDMGNDSIIVHGREQMEQLIAGMRAAANKIWD